MSILTGATSLTPRMATAAAPVFIDAGTVAWTTGDILSAGDFSFSDYITDTSPEGFTVYELHSSSEDLPTTLSVNSTTGDITGTIDAIQGGTYNLVAEVTNLKGTTIITLQAILVGLEITAPTFTGIPNLGNTEQGSLVTVNCADYVTDDGNPAAVEALTYEIDATSDSLIGHSIDSATGVYTVTVDAAQTIDPTTNIVIKVSNSVLSSTDNFNIPIIASGGVVPQAAGLYTGNAGCTAAVIPTWGATGATFFKALSDTEEITPIDMLGLYLASNGEAAITAVTMNTGSFPTNHNFLLQTTVGGAGIGFITGDIGTAVAADTEFTLTAANSAGVSATSPAFTFSIWDDTAVVPTITGISAVEGTNTAYVYFSESVYAGDADYEVGIAFAVNGAARTATYVGGAGTGILEYTLDGAVFSGNNTVQLTFVTTSSDLKSSSSDVAVPSALSPPDFDNYVVPTASAGVVFSTDFSSGLAGWDNVDFGNVTLDSSGGVGGTACAKIAYSGAGVSGYTLKKLLEEFNLSEVYVKFIYKEVFDVGFGNKHLKLFGKRIESPLGYANFTFFKDYSNGYLDKVLSGDGDGIENDQQQNTWYDGRDTGETVNFITTTSSIVPISGQWYEMQCYAKYNTDGAYDGVEKVWVDGVLRLHAEGMRNRHNDNIRQFSYLTFGDYTSSDLSKDVYIDNVIISTEFIE